MPRGGSKPGERRGGRKKGSLNKRTVLERKARAKGILPLDYMLDLLRREPKEDWDADTRARFEALRFEAAKAAAPYLHPRLAATEISGKDGGAIQTKNAITVQFVTKKQE